MGRRKIEIKAIKDDRNRSVTFLKRKGGLFKKAYELSVLCSADVAIIIFGNNKKLYEFSSGNVDEIIERRSYFGLPHERKGPEDYQGKGGGSDGEDDDEDVVDAPNGMRQSNSPPMHHQRNGSIPYSIPHRHLTPQPVLSRPLSRNAPHPHHQRHLSTGAVIGPNGQAMPHPGMGPQSNGFAYVNQYNAGVTQPQVQTIPPGYNFPPNNQHPNGPTQQFIQQQQQHETLIRRQSMPGALPQQPPAQPQHEQQVPPHIVPEQHPAPPQHQPQIQVQNDQGMMEQDDEGSLEHASDGIIRARTKSRSIFTPIAGESSLLAQHWFGPDRSPVRSNSIDVGAMARQKQAGEALKKEHALSESIGEEDTDPKQLPLIRTSTADIPPPTRTPSLISTPGGGLKRPVLKVQIPNDEEDDTNANTAGTSPRNSGLTAEPVSARPHTEPLPPGAVLPPPSPSVGNNTAPLSAGGSGPPNPFARPAPTSAANNLMDQTPISALPSRFVENMLPSPSAFFGADWATGGMRGDDNLLPSPLNFKTPTISRMYPEEDNNASKRKSPDSMDVDSTTTIKRVKT